MKRAAALLLAAVLICSLFAGCSASEPTELAEGRYAVVDEDDEIAAYLVSTGKKLTVLDADGAELMEETKFRYDEEEKVFTIDGDDAFSLSDGKSGTVLTVPKKSPLGISKGDYTLEIAAEEIDEDEPAAAVTKKLTDEIMEEEVDAVRADTAARAGDIALELLTLWEEYGDGYDSDEEQMVLFYMIEQIILEQQPASVERVNMDSLTAYEAVMNLSPDAENEELLERMSGLMLIGPSSWITSYVLRSVSSTDYSNYATLTVSRVYLTNSTPECAWFLYFDASDAEQIYSTLPERVPEDMITFDAEELSEEIEMGTFPTAAVVFVTPSTVKADPGDASCVNFTLYLLPEETAEALQETLASVEP